VRAFSPGAEDGLVAVTAAGGGTAWAVGFTTISGQTMPLAMRWDGAAWAVDRPRPGRALASMFTDVTMVERVPFAVGYRMTASGGSQPVAARRDGRRWRYVDPRTGYPSEGLRGVTLIATDIEAVNGIPVAIMVLGKKAGIQLLAPGVDALIADRDGMPPGELPEPPGGLDIRRHPVTAGWRHEKNAGMLWR